MEGFEKFDIKDTEDIKYLIPSGFLEKVNSIEVLAETFFKYAQGDILQVECPIF